MPKLAINSGPRIREKPFVCQAAIQEEEIAAANRVLRSGRLSHYRGNYTPNFYGGPEVLALEEAWSNRMGAKFAIAVNSCTSGLQIACGAVGLGCGDEVIVTPWSMTCSATAPILWNAIPIFADIESNYYCLDANSVLDKITNKTKAIIVVDLFGQPYNAFDLRAAIIDRPDISIIEDAAQAIGATYKGKQAGTLGDIGVFSLTFGKHLTCGEGGIIVTDNPVLAQRCRLLRNHAEAVVNDMDEKARELFNANSNMVGFNMRMTEIEAAIAHEQLKKLDWIMRSHQFNANYLRHEIPLEVLPIVPSPVRSGCTHTYYVQPFEWNFNQAEGIHRDIYLKAVRAELAPEKDRESEGVPIGGGYIKPIYLMPLFQGSRIYGRNFLPLNYSEGLCPVAERLWMNRLFLHRFVGPMLDMNDLNDVVEAFHKVWQYRDELRRN